MNRKIPKFFLALGTLLSLISLGGVSNTDSTFTSLKNEFPSASVNPKKLESKSIDDFYSKINKEVEDYVSKGILESFHLKYYHSSFYQIPYVKFSEHSEMFELWKGYSEDKIKWVMNQYALQNKDWINIVNNIHVPLNSIKPNQPIGLYFDGTAMNFIWSSRYLPLETYNLQSITINNKLYQQKEITDLCPKLNGDEIFELTSFYSLPNCNIQLNMTPINSFFKDSDSQTLYQYGVDINTTEFKISSFSANLDPLRNGVEIGKEDEELGIDYKIESQEEATFTFTKTAKYQENAMLELSTHCYVEITDIECQSAFVLNFGGYEHSVYFNTSLDLDDIYRVDVNYNVETKDKNIFDIFAVEGKMEVAKSLTPDISSGGLFGLSRYKGLTKGNFQSNNKESKSYQYQLFLNYDDDSWNFFKGNEKESKYTNIIEFKILRLDFLYKGQEMDVPIKMDEVDGTTLNIFDKDLIANTDSTIWKTKDKVEDIKDTINNTDTGTKIKNILLIVLGSIGGIFILFGFYKLYHLIKKVIKK